MRIFEITLFAFFLVTFGYCQDSREVMGTISSGSGPLASVDIRVLAKSTRTVSSDDGQYRIPVETGDVLAYNSQGMEPVRIKVEDVTRVLNVDLSQKVEKLRNVTVAKERETNQRRIGQKHRGEKDLIRTMFGPLDKSRVSYTIRIMDQDDITQGEYNLINVLRGRFPGLRFGTVTGFARNTNLKRNFGTFTGSGNLRSIFMRGGSPVTYDIDGQLFTDFPDFIDVQNIERIAVIPSLAGTVRYGTFGRGGVVIINTKAGNTGLKDENGLYWDNARLRDNCFDETILSEQAAMKSAPTYLKELNSANSLQEAKLIFERNSKKYSSSPYYILDSYQHFYSQWKDVAYADDILQNRYRLFEDNAVLLKALAYIYESQGRYKPAYETLKEAFILRPQYAQSYLDIANSNRNLNRVKKAATLYARYFYLLKRGLMQTDTSGVSTIIKREFNNLLALSKAEIVGKDKTSKIELENDDFEGTRLVFEWNDGEAEFDLQFVSPKNQYYTWKHSLAENADAIMKEKDLGYSCSEYLIDDLLSGTWKINVKYLGNKSLTPTYLKASIYHNYGSKAQQKEVKVFKLDVKNANRELFQITKTPSTVSG